MKKTSRRFLAALFGLSLSAGGWLGCGSSSSRTTSSVTSDWHDAAEKYMAVYLQSHPGSAVSLGFHEHDGALPDLSAEGLAKHIQELEAWRDKFAALDKLPNKSEEIDRQIVLITIRRELFKLKDLDAPRKNPMFYTGGLSLEDYVAREYASPSVRAKAIIKLASGAERYVGDAMKNLPQAMPNTWLETALMQLRGMVEFAKTDAKLAMAALPENEKPMLDQALTQYQAALGQFIDFLDKRRSSTHQQFAIGEAALLKMLAEEEGIVTSLLQLEAMAATDWRQNYDAVLAEAKVIDPSIATAQTDLHIAAAAVVQAIGQDKPAQTDVLKTAGEQAAKMRQFLLDKDIVSIPSESVAEVRESPAFMRWNQAFLSGPGAFEKANLPAFYYISPPDPTWSAEEQKDYVPSHADLLFTTIHEVWPGHFLQSLHEKRTSSRIQKMFCSYAMSEGWAHYAEEMMWQQGVGNGDPKLHIGQLKEALLRNVRFLASIGMHAKGMTVDEAQKKFEHDGFADTKTARQQAVRGTFDPGYLYYTLGKIFIKKLRDDWQAKMGNAYSLKAFHDEFLSYGCAPLAVVEQAMLEK